MSIEETKTHALLSTEQSAQFFHHCSTLVQQKHKFSSSKRGQQTARVSRDVTLIDAESGGTLKQDCNSVDAIKIIPNMIDGHIRKKLSVLRDEGNK